MLVTLIVLSILIVIHEFGHFIMAKKVGVKVERFSLGFGPKIFSKNIKETQYQICAIPLGGYVKLAGDNPEEAKGESYEYLSKKPADRAKIVFCGPVLNYIAAFFCLWVVFYLGYPTLTTKVGQTVDGFGAQQAGILPDDKIVAVDGQTVEYWEDLQKIIHGKKNGQIVNLSIFRNQEKLNVDVEIRQKEIPGLLGDSKSVGLIGIQPSEDLIKVRYGLGESFMLSVKKVYDITILTYKAIWRMIIRKVSIRDTATGPLGIFFITSKIAELGIIAVIHLMGVLNVSLAIFNLLPLPVLDGGHIFLLAIEKIRGRRLGQKADQVISQIGLGFIAILALFVLYNDLVNFEVFDKVLNLINPH